MASPQIENGYTNIANEILEALWKINLSSYETRVLIYLIRKTYGWHKKMDSISLSQFQKDIGIDRRLIQRTLKELSSRGMIAVIPQDDRKPLSYGFQKDYESWSLSSPKMTHHKSVIPQAPNLSSPEMHTKERTKETNVRTHKVRTKEFFLEDSPQFKLSRYLWKWVIQNFPKTKTPDFQLWARRIDLMIRIDKRLPNDIGKVIEWCQKDSFWKSNILSTEKLRKQFDTLQAKMGANHV